MLSRGIFAEHCRAVAPTECPDRHGTALSLGRPCPKTGGIMKESSLRDYFASAPGWQRQLAQLRKKCLAGYADGVIRLQDATSEECRAAEGLLGRHFVPPRLHYKVSDFEKALRESRFAVADLAAFWLLLDGAPLRSHARQKADRQAEVRRSFAAEAALPHG